MGFSLMDKLLGKPVVVTKEAVGRQVVFRILSSKERIEVWRNNPTSDIFTASEVIAIPTLVKAIQSIDGVSLADTDEVKELREQFPDVPIDTIIAKHLSAYPYPIINELYVAYVSVVDEFQQQLTGLKKNSTQLSLEPSGESAKSLEKTL